MSAATWAASSRGASRSRDPLAKVIPDPIGHRRRQVRPERAAQVQLRHRAHQADEHVLHHIFRRGGIVQKVGGQRQQIAFVLLIDQAQGVLVAVSQTPQKSSVFEHRKESRHVT